MAWRSLLSTYKNTRTNLSPAFSNSCFYFREITVVSESFTNRRGTGIEVFCSNSGKGSDFNSFRCLTSSSIPLGSRDSGPRAPVASVPLLGHCNEASTGNLQIENGEILYSGMTSKELVSSLFNLYLVAYEPLVDITIKVLKSPLVMEYAALRVPVMEAVKRTAYSHFCAGENVAEASATLKRMWEMGFKGILNYSLEESIHNASCNKNLYEFLNTIQTTLHLPVGSVSFACVKITALCPLPLLERVSDLLRWRHRHPDYTLPWLQDTLPILAESSPTYHTPSPPVPLTDHEENDLRLAEQRLRTLCKSCEENSLPLLIDAEYTSVQPAIDYFTYSAALEFNRYAKPLVYGTIQAYLKDALPRLQLVSDEATRRRVQIGLKLVRGAYMTRESALAASVGATSPIHSSIQDTHRCYDTCAALMMAKAAIAEGSVVLATHNFDSGKAAVVKAEELNIRKGNDRVQFAQLKGMADSLSLGLVQAGFLVSKYLPFGGVEQVMPYLIRRAEENRGLLSTTTADRKRISRELTRRLQAVTHGC